MGLLVLTMAFFWAPRWSTRNIRLDLLVNTFEIKLITFSPNRDRCHLSSFQSRASLSLQNVRITVDTRKVLTPMSSASPALFSPPGLFLPRLTCPILPASSLLLTLSTLSLHYSRDVSFGSHCFQDLSPHGQLSHSLALSSFHESNHLTPCTGLRGSGWPTPQMNGCLSHLPCSSPSPPDSISRTKAIALPGAFLILLGGLEQVLLATGP